MAAHFDALGDTADGKLGCGQPEVMDFDLVAESLGLIEEFDVGGAAQGALEAEGYAGFQTGLEFVEQEFPGFDCDFLGIEW